MDISPDGVWQLCDRLRSEKLLVSSEVDSLRMLHTNVEEKLSQLGLLSWNNHQHQVVLQRLIGSHVAVSPENAASIGALLDAAEVVEAHKRLGHHHSSLERVLSLLNGSPRSVAEVLHAADSNTTVNTEELVHCMFSLVHGNNTFPSDEKAILETLSHLVNVQLVTSSDPRLVLRKGTSAFPRLYRLFSETLFASKIFLTAALHDSVMLVLCQDDTFLDIDPSKSALRFPAAERVRRFGEDATSPAYHKRVAAHRKIIVEKLVLLAHHFIKGVTDALSCFPASLIWLVKQLHSSLIDIKGLSKEEATLICTDLIVTSLLCPSITNPETVGVVSDTPISHIARFNLMQIGQIVQTLSLSRHEAPPPHFQLFTNQFRESSICTLVESLLSRPTPELDTLFPLVLSEPNGDVELFKRQHFMGSLAQVNVLVSAYHSGIMASVSSPPVRDEIDKLCRRLPASFASSISSSVSNNEVDTSPTNQPRQSRLRNFADKVQTSLQSSSHSPSRASASSPTRSNGTPPGPALPAEYYDVVIFQNGKLRDPLGLTPEDAFMDGVAKDTKKSDGREKRARFVDTSSTVGSAVSDRTTDNASDLEEEAADQDEVGSVSSSQEAPQEDRMLLLDEDNASTLPDNVSDVGGMSGHGSPSLSGRDTPLSQSQREPEGAEQEQEVDVAAASTAAGGVAVSMADRHLPPVPVAVRKQNAEGLEEKFGKFTVPTSDQNRPYRDDQRSLLSDSWSTNVVASDDEGPVPPPALPQPPEDPNRLQRPVNRTGSVGGGGLPGEDRSDTWSLDAIASDSEADGGRDRETRDEERRNDGTGGRELSVEGLPVQPLIDVSPSIEGNDRVRRRSSGSSFSYSRSDAGSERDQLVDRVHPPPIPSRPPIRRGNSTDMAAPSGSGNASMNNSPQHALRSPLGYPVGPTPPDSPGVPGPSGSAPNSQEPLPGRKKLALFQGLQRVGDKMRKGMANTPLRQMPHSSTLSDLFGEMSVSKDRPSQNRIVGSRSVNRLADLDPRSADDILAKYQRQPVGGPVLGDDVLIDLSVDLTPPSGHAPPPPEPMEPYYSAENLTQCRAFLDAKRKLRLVLSSVGSLSSVPSEDGDGDRGGRSDAEREQLISLLMSLLAEAIHGRQQVLSAHIREAIRCLQVFDSKGVRKLLRSLRDDHRRRTSYVLYLQHSRLTLLRLSSYVDRLSIRVQRDKSLVEECLVDVLIRFYLEHKENLLRRFLQEFTVLKAQDEKTECLSRTLLTLSSRLPQSSMWKDAPQSMRSDAMRSLERFVMGQIHSIAFYPNQEADKHRDDLLHKALSKLARSMTPDHPMMRIPSILHGEAPWPSAQAEISIINAYKSARDKLACIVRCCETISNLVSMAPGVGAAAADDVTPVLVYVLIQANPPALLSNLQYVESFGGELLAGAEGYWWTQFKAAIEFIKTLL